MKSKSAGLKLLGIVVVLAGAVVNAFAGYVDNRAMRECVDEAVEEALSKREKEGV